jgi:tRNA pseudouridine55 synthase
VAVARRCLKESRVGHTGTLDPLATGVLPLACGRATRLIRFLTSSEKDYEASVTFGVATDTYDVTGRETSRSESLPSRAAIERALESLRGEYLQMPPPYSAKKVNGERAYALARRQEAVTLTAVPVRVPRAELLEFDGTTARVALTCSAGFYVRAFAHTWGALTGTAACLASLRRTRSGEFGIEAAVSLDRLHGPISDWSAAITPLERLLPTYPSTVLTDEGRRRVAHGQTLQPAHTLGIHGEPVRAEGDSIWVRLLDTEGRLLGLGTSTAGDTALHPAVVLN